MSVSTPSQSHDRRIAYALLEISNYVGSVMELHDILQTICEIGARSIGTDTCSIYLLDDDEPDFLVLSASKGLSRAQELGVRGFRLGEGVPGWAAQHNQTVVLDDARNDPRYARLDDLPHEEVYMAYICTPIRIQETVVGVLTIRRTQSHWREDEAIFAEIVAKQAAIVIEKARLYHQKIDAERLAAIAISLSEVAHYIKNILQNLMGGGFLIEKGLGAQDIERTTRGWQLLKPNVQKIQNLVENMLYYARETRCQLEPAPLNPILTTLAEESREALAERDIQLNVTIDESIPTLLLDVSTIHDAILNLLSNARDAIPEGQSGVIELRSEFHRASNTVRICIRDNGNGIPADVQKKMFNLFFSTKGKGGTGIGLAATRKIVDEHGGHMCFDTKIGEGTTFFIELPVPRPGELRPMD
ncbi:MAG: GAF domain-containing sensor histidine kinase [Candidatus Sumerlaeia bacterium]|nr:GAF domain-containing sensor histidine kinase [Candidatus Sumerlaeia bacterium]